MDKPHTDENVSWTAGTTIMVVASIVALTTRFLGMEPFTIVFDIFIVYAPTAVLLGTILFKRLRQPTA